MLHSALATSRYGYIVVEYTPKKEPAANLARECNCISMARCPVEGLY